MTGGKNGIDDEATAVSDMIAVSSGDLANQVVAAQEAKQAGDLGRAPTSVLGRGVGVGVAGIGVGEGVRVGTGVGGSAGFPIKAGVSVTAGV